MNIEELRKLSASELQSRVRELKDEVFHLRLQKASGQLEKPHLFKLYKKEIARCLTILTEQGNSASQGAAKELSK